MDERVKFIARFLEGEKVATLSREFGISRKTAYKIIERYQDTGLEGLTIGAVGHTGMLTSCRSRSKR